MPRAGRRRARKAALHCSERFAAVARRLAHSTFEARLLPLSNRCEEPICRIAATESTHSPTTDISSSHRCGGLRSHAIAALALADLLGASGLSYDSRTFRINADIVTGFRAFVALVCAAASLLQFPWECVRNTHSKLGARSVSHPLLSNMPCQSMTGNIGELS